MKQLLIIATIVITFSCKKETAAHQDAVIVINTPTTNQHFAIGDTIRVTGTVTHNVTLQSVAVHMTNLSTNNEFFHYHFGALDKTTYNFNATYKVIENNKTSFKVEVEAIDKDGFTDMKDMLITIN